MASFRKSGVNRPQKAPFINGTPTNDTRIKNRSGVIVPNRVFVGGICPSATENDLFSLFAKYGAVRAVKILYDQNGSSKGYGFVTYEKPDDVTRLTNDAKNLIFNERRLNIAPAVMKNPPFANRYPDSYLVPVAPNNMYFANNIPYQYQEGNNVFPNGHYPPPLTVLPAVSDPAYYPNGYSSPPNFLPSTPYQGAALFYPVPHNSSQVVIGHQPYTSYQPATVSNSNYIYSSPAPATSSPATSSAKTSNAAASAVTNTSDVHGSHASQMATAPPNVASVPPPLPYQLAPPPQCYNGGTVIPPYSGEVYYNIQSACYPMMAVGGHDSYIPYFEVSDACANNLNAEENNYESQNYHGTTPTTTSAPTPAGANNAPNYADMNGKEAPNAATGNDSKPLVALNATPPSEQYAPESYVSESNNVVTPQPPHHAQQHAEYNAHSNYVQHRSAIIYPNTPNLYFNSIYMTDATTPNIGQTPYPKNLSEHCVSDHLPKRDSKYAPAKKYPASPQSKDNVKIPNIPQFPFYVNNNYPGCVNRNVKDKEYQKNAPNKVVENKQSQRPPRSNSNGSGGPKHRVFHNQNQYATAPRPQRNNVGVQGNVSYPRSSSVGPARSYEQSMQHNVRAYEYQNSYQKSNSYEKKNQANGGYRVKYEKMNGQSNYDTYVRSAPCDERVTAKKYTTQNEDASVINNNTPSAITDTSISVNDNNNTECNTVEQNDKGEDDNVQVQVCAEMQNLAL